ncbi:ABC transporter substrate-binding protein [Brachybacterium huguangmaarense]
MSNQISRLSRRGLLGAATAGAGALALSACAGTGGGEAQGGDATKLQFWSNHPGSSKEIEQKLIEGFQSANKDITVTLIDAGKNYEEVAQKFNAALSGGDLPDIVVVSDVTWFNFALNEQITPLDDLFEKAGVDPEGYVQPLYEDYTFKDKHFALPYSRSTPLFYYNKALWSAAGLPDQGPESWEQLREWADALKNAGGAEIALALPDGANYLDWAFQGMAWSMGGAYSNEYTAAFTEDGTLKAAELLQEFKKAGLLNVSADPAPVFSSGQAACAIQSTGSLKGTLESVGDKFEVGTAFLPGPEGKSCPTGGAGLAIPAGISEERKVNALKAIGFFTNDESTATFAQGTGYMPVRTKAVDSETIKAYLQEVPQAQTALDQLPHTKPQDAARVFVPGGGKKIGGELDKLLGGTAATDILQGLQDWAQPELDKISAKAK